MHHLEKGLTDFRSFYPFTLQNEQLQAISGYLHRLMACHHHLFTITIFAPSSHITCYTFQLQFTEQRPSHTVYWDQILLKEGVWTFSMSVCKSVTQKHLRTASLSRCYTDRHSQSMCSIKTILSVMCSSLATHTTSKEGGKKRPDPFQVFAQWCSMSSSPVPALSQQGSSRRQETAEEVRSELQRGSGSGLNDRKREEMEIRQQEETALKILPQLWLVSPAWGGRGQRDEGSLNDILQRNQSLHTLLKSPLVSNNKTIFTGSLSKHQAARHITKHTTILLKTCSCKIQMAFPF